MKTFCLENDFLKADFDEKTGALLSLVSKKTNWQIQRRPNLGLSFKMLVPLPNRRNNSVIGINQMLSDTKISKDGQSITFTWENLKSEFCDVPGISFKQTVSLNDDELIFDAQVSNKSEYVVEAVSAPYIGDLSRPVGTEKLCRYSAEYGGMAKAELFPRFFNNKGYYGVDNPIQMIPTPTTQFVVIDADDSQGLYAGYHDKTAKHMVQFTFELKPGYEESNGVWAAGTVPQADDIAGQPVRIEFSAIHFPFAAGGETVSLGRIVLKPYAGTWHRGVDCYKKWRKTWFKSAKCPQWAKDVHSWFQLHINSPEDELRCKYKDLVQYGRDCKKHGISVIQLVGWNKGGQDRGNPSHDIDPRLGTWEELCDVIAEIQGMGVKIILFNKYTWADRSEQWFRDELVRFARTDPYGDYHVFAGYQYQTPTQLSDINTRRLIPMCMNSAEWRKIALKEFKKSIELGAAGMLYDESQHHGGATYCFDKSHGHHVPAYIYEGDAYLAQEFREYAQKASPDYLFAGENCYDLEFPYYALSYNRIADDHIPVERYIDSDMGLMIGVFGFNDRSTINQALLYKYIISYEPRNFKGRLDEFPLTLEYGKKVDELRRRYSNYLWHAEYCGMDGAKVTADGKPLQSYSVFRDMRSQKCAVVVANFDHDKPLDIRVALDNNSSLSVVTPEKPDSCSFNGTHTIAANSVAVFLEK